METPAMQFWNPILKFDEWQNVMVQAQEKNESEQPTAMERVIVSQLQERAWECKAIINEVQEKFQMQETLQELTEDMYEIVMHWGAGSSGSSGDD